MNTLMACAAALALCIPSSLASAIPTFGDYPLVKKITCGKGSGTAFRVGRTTLLSVDHVTRNEACKIDGVAFWVKPEPDTDFSVIELAGPKAGGFKINCEGFKAGEYYWAIGHAMGGAQRVISLYSYGRYAWNGMAALWGYPTVIPGMSGGPIINIRGEVVGTVNMYNPFAPVSLSRELRDTSVCKGKAIA